MRSNEAAPLAGILACMAPWSKLGYPAETLAGYLTRPDPGITRWSIFDAEGICGALCVRERWLRGPYLELICIFPRAQRLGLGTRVMDWLARNAALSARNLWTSATASNHRARVFYQMRGFAEVAFLADLIRAGEDEILFRKRLDLGM